MKLNKIFQSIYYLLVIVLILIIVLFVGSKLPITGNYKLMAVMSGSMVPTIKIGSIVVVKPVENYRIGDIVTFGEENKKKIPTTHRIIEVEVVGGTTLFTSKGDANKAPDPQKIRKEDILGKFIFSLPYFGYAIDFVRKPVGFMIVIILPAAILIADEIRKIWRESKKKTQKKEFST